MDISRLPQYPGDGGPAGGRPVEPDHTGRYRELRAAGRDRDAALGVLRVAGARFIHCLAAVSAVDGLSVGEAKAAVHSSPAWADGHPARETFWDELARSADEI